MEYSHLHNCYYEIIEYNDLPCLVQHPSNPLDSLINPEDAVDVSKDAFTEVELVAFCDHISKLFNKSHPWARSIIRG